MIWTDSYDRDDPTKPRPLFGSADFDSPEELLRPYLRTPGKDGDYGRADVDDDDGGSGPVDEVSELGFLGTDDGFTDISQAAQEWALAEALNQKIVNDGEFGIAINMLWESNATFAQFLANTVSHEIGHTFGLNDSYVNRPIQGQAVPFPGDIMMSGSRFDGDLTFASENITLLKAAMGLHDNGDSSLEQALAMYRANINLPNVSRSGIRDEATIEEPLLVVTQAGFSVAPGQQTELGMTAVDGPGGVVGNLPLLLKNVGYIPLSIDGLELANGSDRFSILNADIIGMSLDPGEEVVLSVQFDPDRIDDAADTLTIHSNSGSIPAFSIGLRGSGISSAPAARLNLLANNNLGGLPVFGAGPHPSHSGGDCQ